jgi:hydrogenase expression/formation protein HypE
VILSGTLGDHHACILSARMKIENDIRSDCAPLNSIVDALYENNVQVKTMRDVTRGGLGTILNELANSSGCGIEIIEKDLPIHQDVKGFSDILGLDPLYMANEGKMLVIVKQEEAEKALAAIRNTDYGKDAAIIGAAVEGKGVALITPIGGKRVVDVLYGEGLPRIC